MGARACLHDCPVLVGTRGCVCCVRTDEEKRQSSL